jgi:cysteine-rich repeat protein
MALRLMALALGLASCVSLRDLDSYANGERVIASDGGSSGGGGPGGGEAGGSAAGAGPSSEGGHAGAAAGEAGWSGGGAPDDAGFLCGNARLDDGEQCDDGGPTTACTRDCKVRDCPEGYYCEFLDGTYYALSIEPLAWGDGLAACAAEGMILAVPRSERENAFVRALASRKAFISVWLGATDAVVEGEWLNEVGEPLWYGKSDGDTAPGAYTNWALAQPDDYTSADCLRTDERGKWDDNTCDTLRQYVCSSRPATYPSCGDGTRDPGEPCDSGAASEECDADCTAPHCGDGVVNTAAGEECDDGNAEELDACSSQCARTGLVAHLPLDEQLGSIAWDRASYLFHGDVRRGGSFEVGNQGVALDGTSKFVEIPIGRAPSVIGRTTLMLLAKPAALPLPDGLHDLIGHNSSGTETYLRFDGAVVQAGSWWSTGEHNVNYAVDWSSPDWHHLAARYNGVRWSLFIDGALVASLDSANGSLDVDGPWEIGGRVSGRYFSGNLKDVRIYDRDLPNASIAAISAAALAGVAPVEP